jgi:long-chain acyl-CoA synthetase
MMDTIPKLLFDYCTKHAETEAVLSKDSNNNFQPISHREFYNIIKDFGCGLIDSGIKRENHIGVISDNRKEWLWADFAILSIGAVDVPRGSDSTAEEIRYILFHGDCVATLVEDNTQLEKILSIANKLRLLKMIIVMDNSSTVKKKGKISIYNFSDILERGKKYLEKNPGAFEEEIGKSKPEDLATIIYTSGTTGEPKGVMLSHSNFMHQVISPHQYLYLDEKDVYFAVLPVWHAYERSCEYYAFFHGVIIAYSRLVAKIMIEDMGKVRPNVFVSVPRIWVSLKSAINRKIREEGGIRLALFNFFIAVGTIHSKLLTMFRGLLPRFKKRVHLIDVLISFIPLILLTPLALLGNLLVFSKIKARLGGRFYLGVSGAGALPPHVDDFFAGAGLLILEGYGLTEAAPIVSVRKRNAPVPGTIGPPLPEVEAKVLDEEGNELPPGKKGILFIRGHYRRWLVKYR